MLSFELMPEKDAQKKNNGYGRDGPNLFPVLPEPVGRFKFVKKFFFFIFVGNKINQLFFLGFF